QAIDPLAPSAALRGGLAKCAGDEPPRGESLERGVHGAGRRRASRTSLDQLTDRHAVALAGGQRQEGEEDQLLELSEGAGRRHADFYCTAGISARWQAGSMDGDGPAGHIRIDALDALPTRSPRSCAETSKYWPTSSRRRPTTRSARRRCSLSAS